LADLKTCIAISIAFQKLKAEAEGVAKAGSSVSEVGVVCFAESCVRFVAMMAKAVCGGGKSLKKLLGRIGTVEVELRDISWVMMPKPVHNTMPMEKLRAIFVEMERCLSEFGAAVTRHSFSSVKTVRILIHCMALGMGVAEMCGQALGLNLTKVSVDAMETLLDAAAWGAASSEPPQFFCPPAFVAMGGPFVPRFIRGGGNW
jgi:hypothetical protein